MGSLKEALEKYDGSSSAEELIKGIQNGGYKYGLNPSSEAPNFQNYLISLLKLKTDKELAMCLNNFKDVVKEFSLTSSKSAKILNFWTKALVFTTIALVIVTIVGIFK